MSLSALRQLQSHHLTAEEFQKLPREDQAIYLQVMNQEIDWLRTQKVLLYEPMAKQREFHLSPCPRRALFGGNRVGKTTAGGMEFLYHLTGQYPEWYPESG